MHADETVTARSSPSPVISRHLPPSPVISRHLPPRRACSTASTSGSACATTPSSSPSSAPSTCASPSATCRATWTARRSRHVEGHHEIAERRHVAGPTRDRRATPMPACCKTAGPGRILTGFSRAGGMVTRGYRARLSSDFRRGGVGPTTYLQYLNIGQDAHQVINQPQYCIQVSQPTSEQRQPKCSEPRESAIRASKTTAVGRTV